MGNYETLNELLVTLFRDVMDIEQKVIITPEFKDITNNDMHVIEAIGLVNRKICHRLPENCPLRWERSRLP